MHTIHRTSGFFNNGVRRPPIKKLLRTNFHSTYCPATSHRGSTWLCDALREYTLRFVITFGGNNNGSIRLFAQMNDSERNKKADVDSSVRNREIANVNLNSTSLTLHCVLKFRNMCIFCYKNLFFFFLLVEIE